MKSERVVGRWGIVSVGGSQPFIVGRAAEGLPRTLASSSLASLDLETMTAMTVTGRPWRLVGTPAPDRAEQIVRILWDVGEHEIRVLSLEEALQMIAKKGGRT